MRIPTVMRTTLWSSIVLALLGVTTCHAATASWSPRSSNVQGHVWTRAGWIRTGAHAEIAPANTEHRRPAPPSASASAVSTTNRCLSEARSEHQTQSRDRVQVARTVLARFRTSAIADRRARSAALAALAGVFHEAHAPPSLT